jgi:hypothetical protein
MRCSDAMRCSVLVAAFLLLGAASCDAQTGSSLPDDRPVVQGPPDAASPGAPAEPTEPAEPTASPPTAELPAAPPRAGGCPDSTAPGVQYHSTDPDECARLRFACDPGRLPFSDACGCGCQPDWGCAATTCGPGTRCEVDATGRAGCIPDISPCAAVLCAPGTTCEVQPDGSPACRPGGAPADAGGPGHCFATGCSGEVCADHEVVTICMMRPEHECYQRYGECARQPDGECGWTPTAELTACVEDRTAR